MDHICDPSDKNESHVKKFWNTSIIHGFKDHFLVFKMTPKTWPHLSF